MSRPFFCLSQFFKCARWWYADRIDPLFRQKAFGPVRKIFLSLIALTGLITALLFLVLYPPIKATHPALQSAALPDLVPLNKFYADHNAKWRYRLSPDGSRLAWLEAKRLKPALWVQNLEEGQTEIFHTPDEVRWYTWSANGKYLIYQADRDGWENDQIVSVDVTQAGSEPRTYDFGKDVKSWIQYVPETAGSEILVAHNGRNRSYFDLYRLNLDTGETTAMDEVANQSVGWSFTRTGEIFARWRNLGKNQWTVELKEGAQWREIAKGGMLDSFHILSEPDENGTVQAVSNLGRDKSALVQLDLETGLETVLHEDPNVDLSWVRNHPITNAPLMAVSYPARQTVTVFDNRLDALLQKIPGRDDGALHLVSHTTDFNKTLWEIENDTKGWQKFAIDLNTGEIDAFDPPQIAAVAEHLSPMEPVFIEASDGLTIPAYLTRPKGVTEAGPLVILIHGGPVARVNWGFNDLHSWLANRGYAVLDVNYRGSWGYGRAFRDAATGEVSRKMHQDIVDARAWAVDQGIADPNAVGVMGGSFGGLKTLTAMTLTPDLFQAGVSINGISDLSTVIEEFPPYWTGGIGWYEKYIGDPTDPAQLEEIKRRSPLYNADAMTGSLLIIQGSNDVRVIQTQADRMVEALEAGGKDVTYELLDGAGHTFANMGWKQRIIMFRKIERFLAEHLGGRADGFDYAVLGAQILP